METPVGRRDFSYGSVLGDALGISWRKRYLWWLGLIQAAAASLFSAFGTVAGLFQPNPTTGQVSLSVDNIAALIVVGGIVFLVLVVISIFLSVVCTGGLVSAVAEEDRGRGSDFGAGWRAGLSVFWRLLFQTILIILLAIALFLVPLVVCGLPVLLTFLFSQSVGVRVFVSVVFALLFVLLYIALLIPFTAVGQFAVRELVLKGEGIAASISSGYRLFRANFGRSVALALISLGLAIVVAVVFGIIGFVFNLIFLGPSIGLSVSGSTGAATVTGAVGSLLSLIPTTLLSALTGVFFSAFWTVAYLRIPGVTGVEEQPASHS